MNAKTPKNNCTLAACTQQPLQWHPAQTATVPQTKLFPYESNSKFPIVRLGFPVSISRTCQR